MIDPSLTSALDPANAPRLLAAACDHIRGLENEADKLHHEAYELHGEVRRLHAVFADHASSPYFALAKRITGLRKKLLPQGSNREAFVRWVTGRSRRQPPPPAAPSDPYAAWIARYEAQAFAELATPPRAAPSLHFVLAGEEPTLRITVKSVLAQTDPAWRLLVVCEQPLDVEDSRIQVIAPPVYAAPASAWNRALKSATDGFVAVIRPGDQLAPVAVAALRLALEKQPQIGFIYSDEDALDDAGRRCDPLFKPEWAPETFRAVDYIGNLTAFNLSLVREVGGFRPELGEAALYDLALRVSEKTEAIRHTPLVLCHSPKAPAGRGVHGPYRAYGADGARAVQDHLDRLHVPAEVAAVPERDVRQVRYQVGRPLISIIIPSKDQPRLLGNCVQSLLASHYPNKEIVLADTGSRTPESLEVNDRLASQPGVRLLHWDCQPFNYSAVNNFAVRHARGEVLLFLNDDTEVITPDWMERMVELAMQPRVGIVGAKLLYDNRTIQHAGLVIGTKGTLCDHLLRFAPDDGAHARHLDVVRNVSVVTGACVMMRRSVFEEVGGFEEQFAGDFNDVDLCLKVGRAGYQVVWTPYAQLFHYECQTRGTFVNPRRHALFALERLLFLDRWGAVVERGDPFYNPNLNYNQADYTVRR